MSEQQARGDIRTWLLLVLALLPTWAVLLGAGWLWQERGEEIQNFEHALAPVDTTYELFVVSSRMLRAEASLRVAALPDASEAVIERAQRDLAAALIAARAAEHALVPLIDQLDEEREEDVDNEILALLGGSLTLATEQFEQQIPGEPVLPSISLLVGLSRQSASGLVLPFIEPGEAEAGYIYDAMSVTIDYHDRFDRDRSAVISALASKQELDPKLVSSPLRDAFWKDLTDSRMFVSASSDVAWIGTSADPDAPLLLDTTEPLSIVLRTTSETDSPQSHAVLLQEMQLIDDALEADVDLAYRLFDRSTDDYLASLVHDRRLTALTSCLMALLGLALATLTISEVRRRRRVEFAHAEAVNLLSERADRDPTTGIWNRRRLESSVLKMIAEAPAAQESVVLAYLDLDHFKAINDVWGHSTGDYVLRKVTERLEGFAYRGVSFELCRFGGDEFVLYAQMTERSLEWYEGLGQAIIDAVDSQMQVNGRSHEVGVSVGIATSTEDSSLDSLLLEADSSLILAKRDRGCAVVYNRNISRTGELVHALPEALASGEICVHIQPVIDLQTGQIRHVEALARWNRPGGEQVSPSVFIPLVESYGLAEKLTSTVLGCVQQLINDPGTPGGVRVWVNVSPRELDVANFAERFVSMLHQMEVPPNRIGLEITETAAVRDPERLAIELRRLREVGIAVAIDDFGSGYSPLGYLRILPVDVVKIDRSLISNIDTDIANQHIVVGIVGLVHELGMSIVAEGVERAEEQAWLADHDVNRVQGFLFGQPLPPASFDWSERALGEDLVSLTP